MVREDDDGQHRFDLEIVGIAESAAAHGYPAAGVSPGPDGRIVPRRRGPERHPLLARRRRTGDVGRRPGAQRARRARHLPRGAHRPAARLGAAGRDPGARAAGRRRRADGARPDRHDGAARGGAPRRPGVRRPRQGTSPCPRPGRRGRRHPRQARRTVLASGVVVGAVGGVVGVALGVLVGRLALPLAQRLDDTAFGPFEVPWPLLALVAGFGLVSAVLAAIVPAYSASRQDVVAVLGGRRGEGRPSHRSPVLGAVLLLVGIGAATAGALQRGPGAPLIAGAAIVAVVGMILLVPVTVTAVGRMADRLPLALRFAARDAARHRTRTVPAVAAVGATVAGVVALGIAVSSQEAGDERGYAAQLPDGWASVAVMETAAAEDDVAEVLSDRLPGAELHPVTGLASTDDRWTDLLFRTDGEQLAFAYWGSVGTAHVVAPDVPPYVALAAGDQERAEEMLAAGGVVLLRGADDAAPAVEVDEVTVVAERYDDAGQVAGRTRADRPAVVVAVEEPMPPIASLVAPALVEQLRVPTTTTALVTPGPVSEDAETDLTEAFAALPTAGYFYVERGYVPDPAVRIAQWVLAALGAVLMLGGTLTATFLTPLRRPPRPRDDERGRRAAPDAARGRGGVRPGGGAGRGAPRRARRVHPRARREPAAHAGGGDRAHDRRRAVAARRRGRRRPPAPHRRGRRRLCARAAAAGGPGGVTGLGVRLGTQGAAGGADSSRYVGEPAPPTAYPPWEAPTRRHPLMNLRRE
ncbi:FtsX-like permease family protein [Nocardioides sp. TF02-7]|uniref:FtsX-like permease family protein n=1 Tax=Nocardioides sp. TF02-7 TaxID=2917724 RepID=UPI001F06272B|nr:FtsX-like permease family protein [Nocardioides sp. TF02-7]UMG94047.1 hypothetical protein MF408_08340 [Nocardioides sp. TF02-7]